MNTEHITKFKEELEAEKKVLESDLKSVGHVNPDNSADWEASPAELDETTKADTNDQATRIEECSDNEAIVEPLEARYNEVKKALEKIHSGKGFGVCEVCNKEIELDRLEANPAATTCKEHMK